MYRSLLVPLDGSSFGEHALPLALSIARRAGATLSLAHVHTPLAAAYPEAASAFVDESIELHLKERQRAYLDAVVRRLEAVAPVRVTPVHLEGPVAESIRTMAASTGVDLVVMTTHGRGPLGRLWLGSVADALVRDLPMPLLLVRPGETPADPGSDPVLRHLLLPLDGSALSEQIIEPAVALGSLMEADYTLLRVVRPPRPVTFHIEGATAGQMAQSVVEQIDRLEARLRQDAADYLGRVAERLGKRSLRAQVKVAVEPQPAVAILEAAAPPAIDLVALETHGRRGLSRLFVGSVADKVIRAAPVPVLVHRPVYA